MAQDHPGAEAPHATPLPLSHLKVVDLSHARAGPVGVRHLADWGAQVIKIERPVRINSEDVTGHRDDIDFQNMHRGKKSLTLDLKSDEGLRIFYQLVADADVVVENMRPSVKHRLKVDYETVRAINPRIIYGSISGFGETGPYSDRPCLDQIAQGMGGLMSITGFPDQGPVRTGIPINDLASGGFLAQGILIALIERNITGVGRWVQTSLLESQLSLLDFQAARWLSLGEVASRVGNDHPTLMPTGVYECTDGHINIAASGEVLWQRLCQALGAPELPNDPRFSSSPQRSENRSALNEIINNITRTKPMATWIALLNEHSVPSGPIYSIDQTFADPQVRHIGIERAVKHPRLGEQVLVGQPYRFSGLSAGLSGPTPETGEHTDAILRDLGYSSEEIDGLSRRGVI